MGKKRKQKRQAYIRKILSDGKVSKKEVRKAEKKGIRLSRITSAATKAAKEGNPFSGAASSPARFAGANKTKTTPAPAITIAAGAQKLVDRDTVRREVAAFAPVVPQTGGAGAGAGSGAGDPGTTGDSTLQSDYDAAIGRIGDLETQLANVPDFESIFARQAEQAAAQRQADLDAMRKSQDRMMEEMAARQAEMERERRIANTTSQVNMARASLSPDFKIGGRARADMYGTGGFKRRRKIRPATISKGLLPTLAEATPNGNLLNV